MAYIDDWSSLESQINKYLETPDGKKKSQEVVDKIMLGEIEFAFSRNSGSGVDIQPETIAKVFEEELLSIMFEKLSKNVSYALSSPIHSEPYKLNDDTYAIDVYWKEGTLSRYSLNPKDILVDLGELYDVGVDHEMKRIWGNWHGKHIGNKTTIKGTNFMQEAADNFMIKYRDVYGLKGVHVEHHYQGNAKA